MIPSFIRNHENYKKSFSQQKNQFNISQSISSLKNNHYQINCKSPIKALAAEFVIIKSLWDDLGVNIEYQNEFRNYFNELESDKEKSQLIIYEKTHLRRFRDSLLKLSEDISNRDSNISNLKQYCIELEKMNNTLDNVNNSNNNLSKNNNNSEEEVPSNIFVLIQKEIKSCRINTVNVINRIIKVREVSSYYEVSKKWDPSKVNRSYSFNKNYILMMLNDIEYINNSILLNYIQTDNNSQKTDLFFSNCKYIIPNEKEKLKLSISLELQNEINKCKYIVLQDILLNKIKKFQRKLVINKRNIFSEKSNPVNSAGSNVSTLSKKTKSEIFLSNDKNENKYYEMFGHNKVNLSRTLYYLKKTMGNKYENMFYNEKDLNNAGKNMNIINKFFYFPSQNEPIEQNDDYESNSEYNEEMNAIDNNRAINEYSNKQSWNNYNKINNETNSYILREQINKNKEDNKMKKNIMNNFRNKTESSNNIKKRKRIKKKHKKEKEKEESLEKKIDNKSNKKYEIDAKNSIINEEKSEIKKEEAKEKENKIINKDISEKTVKKKEKEIKKFEKENIKEENVININFITQKKEDKITINKEGDNKNESKSINNNSEIKDKNNEEISKEKMKSIKSIEEKKEGEEEIEEIKKESEHEIESYINISQDHSKFSEENNHISKTKLLQYRQYTEEEIQKFNNEYE